MEIKRNMRVRVKDYSLIKIDAATKIRTSLSAPGAGHTGRVDEVLKLHGTDKPLVRVRFDDRNIVDAFVLGEVLEVIE
jgi:hypothetical protein